MDGNYESVSTGTTSCRHAYLPYHVRQNKYSEFNYRFTNQILSIFNTISTQNLVDVINQNLHLYGCQL